MNALPNPSLHPMCYGWLRQPTPAGERKRWASGESNAQRRG